jgi:hypothetical protein
MGQLPGPSYPFQWSSEPSSPDQPPEETSWRRWFILAIVLLGLLVLGGLVISACGETTGTVGKMLHG